MSTDNHAEHRKPLSYLRDHAIYRYLEGWSARGLLLAGRRLLQSGGPAAILRGDAVLQSAHERHFTVNLPVAAQRTSCS